MTRKHRRKKRKPRHSLFGFGVSREAQDYLASRGATSTIQGKSLSGLHAEILANVCTGARNISGSTLGPRTIRREGGYVVQAWNRRYFGIPCYVKSYDVTAYDRAPHPDIIVDEDPRKVIGIMEAMFGRGDFIAMQGQFALWRFGLKYIAISSSLTAFDIRLLPSYDDGDVIVAATLKGLRQLVDMVRPRAPSSSERLQVRHIGSESGYDLFEMTDSQLVAAPAGTSPLASTALRANNRRAIRAMIRSETETSSNRLPHYVESRGAFNILFVIGYGYFCVRHGILEFTPALFDTGCFPQRDAALCLTLPGARILAETLS